jgi:hypothetical protein
MVIRIIVVTVMIIIVIMYVTNLNIFRIIYKLNNNIMMIFLTILNIINTLAIIYLIFAKKSNYYLDIRKETTYYDNTLLGYRLSLWKKIGRGFNTSKNLIYIKIRNRKKTETREEVSRMIKNYSQQNKLQSLSAKFSWLKTLDEVNQFQKDYSIVDKKIVSDLVANFKASKNIK